jgi:hypothetical protein
MPEEKTSPPPSIATTFAERRAAREAREAIEGKPQKVRHTLRAGLDVEQPVITVVRR